MKKEFAKLLDDKIVTEEEKKERMSEYEKLNLIFKIAGVSVDKFMEPVNLSLSSSISSTAKSAASTNKRTMIDTGNKTKKIRNAKSKSTYTSLVSQSAPELSEETSRFSENSIIEDSNSNDDSNDSSKYYKLDFEAN